MKKTSKFISLALAFMMMGTVILTTGCSKEVKTKAETLVLTVDDSKVYLNEMMYHVMLAEMQGQLYASFVGNAEEYWDIKNEDGITMAVATKNLAMENAIKYELFYKMAMDENYTLTDEEKELSKSKVDNILKNIQAEQLQTFELTEENLIEIQEKIAISTKYYDAYVEKLGVDEEAIIAQFNPTDYKQYDIQYIFSQEEDELASLYEAAKTAGDITTLTKDTNIASGNLTFLEGADTFGEETNLEDVIKTMAVGEVSNLVETVKGYYIIKLIDNASTDKYDTEVRKAVEEKVTEVFETAYETLKKDHKISIKKHVWDQIEIGSNIIQSDSTQQ